MALTVSNRLRMYTGGRRMDIIQVSNSVSTTDDTTNSLLHFSRNGYAMTPISTTTGAFAAQQWLTWTDAASLNASLLTTVTGGITNSALLLVGWGM